MYIDPDVCIDCSACIPACPVRAIFVVIDLPPELACWFEINASEAKRHPVIRSKLPPLDGAEARRRELGF
jgi:ferredoxin